MNALKKLFDKLFMEHGWACFYRRRTNSVLAGPLTSKQPFSELLTSWRYWCADPFIVYENGQYYVFCELMDIKTSHGLLGLAKLNPSGKTYVKPIADLTCHVSYPNVFKVQGTWYMIPETSERKTIELYRAVHFPDKWEKQAVLAENIIAADTTMFEQNGQFYVFIYEPLHNPDKLHIARLNLQTGQLENKRMVKEYDTRVGRPAGNIWIENGKYYRPVQSGTQKYGEKMFIYEFQFDPQSGHYTEQLVKELTLGAFDLQLVKAGFSGCHTYNACGDFEIIDTTYACLSLFRPLRLLLKKFKIGGYYFHG